MTKEELPARTEFFMVRCDDARFCSSCGVCINRVSDNLSSLHDVVICFYLLRFVLDGLPPLQYT